MTERRGVILDEAAMKKLINFIDGYGAAADELERYMKIHLCDETERAAVASIPRLARQWDELSAWRKDEARRLASIFHITADRVATALARYLEEDVEIAATFPPELMDDGSTMSRRLRGKAPAGVPVDRRSQPGYQPEPKLHPNADYSNVYGKDVMGDD